MSVKKYKYDYFCGANITVAMGSSNTQDIDELAGISYNVIDSATPIYGYSSRLFDAVAPGQKLVQGSFVINVRESNYLYKKIVDGSGDETTLGPFNIKIQGTTPGGGAAIKTTIYSAYIIGKASTIQIDEQVILKEYNFIARDLKET